MAFGNHILKYQDAILSDLARMVAIPSVCGKAEPNKPFGAGSARALEKILRIADGMGLKTKNVGNYAGHAEYGEGSEYAAAVVHVDVVPSGEGWKTDPFCLTRRGNNFYGRGTADDKGPAVVALYCLKALKDASVTGNRKIRVIFGAGEEIASDDLATYFKEEPYPSMAFTPDGNYGICNREKGILRVDFSAEHSEEETVHNFHSGTVVNAVPASAEAEVDNSDGILQKLESAAKTVPGDFRFEKTENGVKITSAGKAHHGSEPQLGFNAATHLISLLQAVFPAEKLGSFLGFLNHFIGTETDGESLGIKMCDEPSGPLTLNVGIVRLDSSSENAEIDIRYPVTQKGSDIFHSIKKCAEAAGVNAKIVLDNQPLYFPENHPLIHLLQSAYQAVEGTPAEIYSMGGGTYAREIPGKAVAFGALFPDQPDTGEHNANEFLQLDRYMEHAQICLEAMYRMMKA